MGEPWQRTIGLADPHGTVVKVSCEPPDDALDEPYASVQVTTGAALVTAAPTAVALRQLSAAMLDAADYLEATHA